MSQLDLCLLETLNFFEISYLRIKGRQFLVMYFVESIHWSVFCLRTFQNFQSLFHNTLKYHEDEAIHQIILESKANDF